MGVVSSLLRPFVGFVPDSRFAQRVVGPARATLTEEQKAAAVDDPLSFRHAAGRKAGRPQVEALAWLNDCRDRGVLVEVGPAILVYRQEMGDFVATGLLGELSLEAYETGRVKRHERTIGRTQRKMTKYMRTTRMYGNPPVTTYRPDATVEKAIAAHTGGRPDTGFTTVDGISHSVWVVEGEAADDLCAQITSDLYITDGHHRLAAASLAAAQERRSDGLIPAGVFSANEFSLRSFARCIYDVEFDSAVAITELRDRFEMVEVAPNRATPRGRFEFGAKVGDAYFVLRVPERGIPADHYDSLNTNLLTELVLRPVFGIENPRRDPRLKFLPDLGDIQEAASDADAWFLPYPLQASDVMKVADTNRTMPAKSTWFAPKLPSGLLIRPIDQY